MLALLAIAVGSKGSPDAAFANGLGGFISVWGFPREYAVSLAFASFIVIVLVVTQLLFRVMRVTLTEWLGEIIPPLRNQHVASFVSVSLAVLLVLTGTWIYLWQLFGAANQLMAALSLLLVTIWLVSVRKSWLFAGIPMILMYVTTVASVVVTAYNLYFNVYVPNLRAGRMLPAVGSGLMVLVAVLLVLAALFIGVDGFRAFVRYLGKSAPSAQPVTAKS
jgi:carbon starvation protein